jgi:hypothetical protein
MQVSTTRLIPVPEWPNAHPWPSESGLRHLIFHSDKNGFDKAVRRIGRRILIDEAQFFEWVESSGTSKKRNRRQKASSAVMG